jgi:hypothetical protein
LRDEEAEEARDVFRRVRDLKGVTNQQIADRIDWDVRKLTDALTAGRPLLAGNALQMLRGIADEPSRLGAVAQSEASGVLLRFWHRSEWPRRYRANRRPVAAVIPQAECRRLAEQIADVVAGVNGVRIGAEKKRAISAAVERRLKSSGAAMAQTWYELTAGRVSSIVEETMRGEGPWVDALSNLSASAKPTTIARESVYCAAAIGFPKGQER